MQHKNLSSTGFGCLQMLLAIMIGLTVSALMLYFVFGPKGVLYAVGALFAFLFGQLFLKVFKP